VINSRQVGLAESNGSIGAKLPDAVFNLAASFAPACRGERSIQQAIPFLYVIFISENSGWPNTGNAGYERERQELFGMNSRSGSRFGFPGFYFWHLSLCLLN
jgi:hypothetical protein